MGVRIVRLEPTRQYPDSDYVRVSTCCDPSDDTVTLATIQRVVERCALEEAKKPKLLVRTLVLDRPMSVAAAVTFATRYAERKKIPVVYTELD